MKTDFLVNFSFRFPLGDISLSKIIEQFGFLISELSNLLGHDAEWFETGYSKRQALSRIAFDVSGISEDTRLKWESLYKKDFPLFIESVWDGVGDYSSSINYRKMFFDDPCRVDVELHLVSQSEKVESGNFISLLSNIACFFECSYISLESKGYRFFDKNVFPDRVSGGWMIYVPHVVPHEIISDAVRVVPVIDDEDRRGIIIVSINEPFDGDNKWHIGKANDIEIRLLDLGLLPLMTEL